MVPLSSGNDRYNTLPNRPDSAEISPCTNERAVTERPRFGHVDVESSRQSRSCSGKHCKHQKRPWYWYMASKGNTKPAQRYFACRALMRCAKVPAKPPLDVALAYVEEKVKPRLQRFKSQYPYIHIEESAFKCNIR